MKLGRRPPGASAQRVNCDTTSTPPPTSRTLRFILPASSAKIRRLATLSTMYARSASVSPRPAPSSTSRPGPIAPVTRSPTVTFARETRCTTARMLRLSPVGAANSNPARARTGAMLYAHPSSHGGLVDDKFALQDEQYHFPYHHIPHFGPHPSNIRRLGWGLEYLCYQRILVERVRELAPA